MPDALMLFAAGFGTRMGALTADRPKPLVEVAGKPLIDHALDLAEGVGPLRRVANAHYRADQLAAHLDGRDVALSREEPEILDTGGGLRAALPLLGPDPVFALNTDAVWSGPNPLRLLAEAWDPERMDALLLCVPVAMRCRRPTARVQPLTSQAPTSLIAPPRIPESYHTSALARKWRSRCCRSSS